MGIFFRLAGFCIIRGLFFRQGSFSIQCTLKRIDNILVLNLISLGKGHVVTNTMYQDTRALQRMHRVLIPMIIMSSDS